MPGLRRQLTGFRNYYGLPDNSRSLERLYSHVLHSLFK
ncbi:MAG: RNA-directed DNA polymerase (Reverse transcriptase), partial [Gammaproteobacteria bacterium]|nr:RNA-directed DNA polymerase (Reverse transcriptase) [Gammaproteobacteria bacterium]